MSRRSWSQGINVEERHKVVAKPVEHGAQTTPKPSFPTGRGTRLCIHPHGWNSLLSFRSFCDKVPVRTCSWGRYLMLVYQRTSFGCIDHEIWQNRPLNGNSLMLGCSATGSMQNGVAVRAKVGPFDFTIRGRQFPFAIVAQWTSRTIVGRFVYNNALLAHGHLVVGEKCNTETDYWSALRRLSGSLCGTATGGRPCLPHDPTAFLDLHPCLVHPLQGPPFPPGCI